MKRQKMKVLFINPPTAYKGYDKYAEVSGRNAPLGLLYLATVLKEQGVKVKLLDAEIEELTFEQVLKEVALYNPNLLALTSMTPIHNNAEKLAEQLKAKFPNTTIIIGGPHITADHNAMKNKAFDIGICGEGEETIVELVKCLEENKPLKEVKGLVLRENNKVIKTEPRPLIEDLDSLPMPAWELLDNFYNYVPQAIIYKRKPVGFVITSRGCPFNCIFCDKHIFGSKYRAHSPQRVVKEIECLVKDYKVKEIRFLDDMFLLDAKRVEKICDLVMEKKLKFVWSCSTRVDVCTKKTFALIKQAGCWAVAFGIESGSQRMLDFMKKGITLQQVKQAVGWANEEGLKVRGYFMIGLPTETKESIEETIEFACSLPLNTAEFTTAVAYPNTELHSIAKQYGKLDESDLSKFSQAYPSFVPHGLTTEYLLQKQTEAHKRFFLRPGKMLDFVLQIRSFEDLKRYWRGAKVLLKLPKIRRKGV